MAPVLPWCLFKQRICKFLAVASSIATEISVPLFSQKTLWLHARVS